jgi:capsular exopolysaccharide synthesis family protein
MQQEINVDIGQLLRFIRRGLIPALLIGGLASFAALQLASRQEPVYEAGAVLVAAQVNPAFREFGLSVVSAPPLAITTYREAGRSDPVLASALRRMGIGSPALEDIRRLRGNLRVQIEDPSTSSLIHVIGQGSTAAAATNRANAVANAMVEWDRSWASESMDELVETLEQQVAMLTDQIRSLQTMAEPAIADQITGLINQRAERQQQLSYARALSASATPLLRVLQPASPPTAPVAPRPMLNAFVAFFLGLVLTYGLLLARRALDTRLVGAEDLVHATGLPVLAEFPRYRPGDKSALREASSYLRTNLLFSTADAHPKVFLITSARAGEGKTITVTSLAEGFVRNGYRTLLIDADLRSPSVAKLYRIPGGGARASLVDWLQEPYQKLQPVEVSVGPKQNLYVVPVFQPVAQPAELLSMGFRSCLEKWRQEFDVILIDSAPILAVADALAIAPFSTGTVLVASMEKSDRKHVRTAIDLLRRIGVRVLGVAATDIRHEPGRRQSYGYGYGAVDLVADQPEPAVGVRPKASSRTSRRRAAGKPPV